MQSVHKFGHWVWHTSYRESKKLNFDALPEELISLIFVQMQPEDFTITFKVSRKWNQIAANSFQSLIENHFPSLSKKYIPINYGELKKMFIDIPVYCILENKRSPIFCQNRFAFPCTKKITSKMTYFNATILTERINLIFRKMDAFINAKGSGTFLFNFHMQDSYPVDFYQHHLSDMCTTLLYGSSELINKYPKIKIFYNLKTNKVPIPYGSTFPEKFDHEASFYFHFFEKTWKAKKKSNF